MKIMVETCDKVMLELPQLLQWKMQFSLGLPCDSIDVSCAWGGDLPYPFQEWAKIYAYEGEQVVFTGVIDEVEGSYTSKGAVLEIHGRGMGARLLDNAVLGQEYMKATLEDILAEYVYPFGVELGEKEAIPARSLFLVETGSSAWAVLEDFCGYYGDVVPRFNGRGELLLTSLQEGSSWKVGDDTAVTEIGYAWKRYGACSEFWVRDRVTAAVNKVVDSDLQRLGLCRRGVVTTSSRSTNQKRIHDGEYRMKQSQEEMLRLTVSLPWVQCIDVGEIVEVQRYDFPYGGRYRVLQVEIAASGEGGVVSTLELGAV